MRARTASAWPRVFAQLIATGDVVEVERGHGCGALRNVMMLAKDYAPAWIVWSEYKHPERVGANAASHGGLPV